MEVKSPIAECKDSLGAQSIIADDFQNIEECKADVKEDHLSANADNESPSEAANAEEIVEPQPNPSDDEDDCVYIGATHYISLISSEEDEPDDEEHLLKPMISDHQETDESDSSSESTLNTEIKKNEAEVHQQAIILENAIATIIDFSDDEYKSSENIETEHEEERILESKTEDQGLVDEVPNILFSTEIEKPTENTTLEKPKVLWSQPMPCPIVNGDRPSQLLMAEFFGTAQDDNTSNVSDSSDTSSSKKSKNSDNSSDNTSDSSSSSSSDGEKSDQEKKSSDSETESGEVSDDDENIEHQEKEVELPALTEVSDVPDIKKPKMDC